MTETQIKDKIMKYLKALPECYAVKMWGNHTTIGQPDILACHRGRFLALEVKRPGEQPTEIQKATLAKWAEAGAVAGVVRSVDDTKLACGIAFGHTMEWYDFTKERDDMTGRAKEMMERARMACFDGEDK